MTNTTNYPIPTHRYLVTIGGDEMPFSAVSGLDISYETITHKNGDGSTYHMPGQINPVDISLKRGMFKGSNDLYEWISSISGNKVQRKDVSISLITERSNQVLVSWNIANAFPTKLTAPSLDASTNEISVEEVSLRGERITIHFH